MWSPTHVVLTVKQATGLLTKGQNNTNDCFVTIALGKVKYQTSVKLKAGPSVEWQEECELPIPDQGNTAEIILTCLHRNFLGVDEFLGRVAIPLASFDIYQRPKYTWYDLEAKPGKENKKERGKIEAKIAFTVKAGSLTDLSKKDKHKSSIGQLSQVAHSVGGSLMSIGSLEKRKGLKKFAKSIGSKMNFKGHKKYDSDNDSISGSVSSLKRRIGVLDHSQKISKQVAGDADPGVVSDEEDDFHLDELSHNSSQSSLNQTGQQVTPNPNESLENLAGGEILRRHTVAIPPKKPPRLDNNPIDEWEQKLYGKSGKGGLHVAPSENLNRRSWESSKLSSQIEEEETIDQTPNSSATIEPPKTESKSRSPLVIKKDKDTEKESGMFTKLKYFRKDKNIEAESKTEKIDKIDVTDRVIIGGENEIKSNGTNNRLSNELLQKFSGKSREDLILLVCELQGDLDIHKRKLKDLEDYLDDLLLRVMETTPRILQNPYVSCKMAHSKLSN